MSMLKPSMLNLVSVCAVKIPAGIRRCMEPWVSLATVEIVQGINKYGHTYE